MNANLSNGAQGVLMIMMQGTQQSFGGQGDGLSITSTQVKLGQDATKPLYQGSLTDLRSNEVRWRMFALLSNVSSRADRLQVEIEMQLDASGQVLGVIQGIPVQGSPTQPTTPSTPTTRQV